MEKVIATVVQTLFVFFEKYPDNDVYFEGSTLSRTRLYRIILSKELTDAKKVFVIQGFIGE